MVLLLHSVYIVRPKVRKYSYVRGYLTHSSSSNHRQPPRCRDGCQMMEEVSSKDDLCVIVLQSEILDLLIAYHFSSSD